MNCLMMQMWSTTHDFESHLCNLLKPIYKKFDANFPLSTLLRHLRKFESLSIFHFDQL